MILMYVSGLIKWYYVSWTATWELVQARESWFQTSSKSYKYFRFILDSKLYCKLIIEHKVQKITVAYNTCRKMLDSQCRFPLRTPNIVKWIYASIKLDTHSYMCLVRSETKKKFTVNHLYRAYSLIWYHRCITEET